MSTAKKEFEEILKSLLYQCLAGDANYRLWKKLDEALSKFPNLNKEYSTYFRITKDAYYELFFFNLCRLIDTSGQATNVEKGLMHSKKYLNIFEFQDEKSMEKIIDEDR